MKYTLNDQIQLQKLMKKAKDPKVRIKAHGLWLRTKNYSHQEISEILDISPRTSKEWVGLWHKKGMKFLKVKKIKPRHSYLTDKQRQKITTILRTKKPKELDLRNNHWSTQQLKTYLFRKYNLVYKSDNSVRKILKDAGLSYQKPIIKDINQDKAKHTEFAVRVKKKSQNTTGRVMLSW